MVVNICSSSGVRQIVFALALLTVGCKQNGQSTQWWRGQQQVTELSHQLQLAEFRLQQMGANELPELEKLQRANDLTAASLQSLKLQASDLKQQVEAMSGSLGDFRKELAETQRRRVIGKVFPEFTSGSGRVFRNVMVASIDDAGVAIRHADGSARLGYQDLNDDQRRLFALESDLAHAAIEKESREVAAYEQWIDGQLKVQRERDQTMARLDDSKEDQARASLSASLARQTTAANVSPLSKPATFFGSVRSRYSSSYRNNNSYYRYVYYDTPSRCGPTFSQGRSSCGSSLYRPVVIQNRRDFANTQFQIEP